MLLHTLTHSLCPYHIFVQMYRPPSIMFIFEVFVIQCVLNLEFFQFVIHTNNQQKTTRK